MADGGRYYNGKLPCFPLYLRAPCIFFPPDSGNFMVTREFVRPDLINSGGNVSQPPPRMLDLPFKKIVFVFIVVHIV